MNNKQFAYIDINNIDLENINYHEITLPLEGAKWLKKDLFETLTLLNDKRRQIQKYLEKDEISWMDLTHLEYDLCSFGSRVSNDWYKKIDKLELKYMYPRCKTKEKVENDPTRNDVVRRFKRI